jgi:hypothetical protein
VKQAKEMYNIRTMSDAPGCKLENFEGEIDAV